MADPNPNPNLNPEYVYLNKQRTLTRTLTLTEKLSLQLFCMANFDRVNGPIDMRVWKGRRFENILKLDRNSS